MKIYLLQFQPLMMQTPPNILQPTPRNIYFLSLVLQFVSLFSTYSNWLNFCSFSQVWRFSWTNWASFVIYILTLEIFWHSIGILLLAWFIWKQWVFSQIWIIWAIGSLLPIFFEVCGLIFIRLHYRKVLKIS